MTCDGWSDPALGALLGFAAWGALHFARDAVGAALAYVDLARLRGAVRNQLDGREGGGRP
jgi:hypothetical protein